MKASTAIKYVATAALLAFVLNLFFGRFLLAKLSTWPFLARFKILDPQAPIVITNRQEIRLTDSGQLTDALNAASPKLSLLVFKDGTNLAWAGTAVNLSSSGVFVAAPEAFTQKGQAYVVLSDGSSAKVLTQVSDPGTGLVFFTADLKNMPIAVLADSAGLNTGDKILIFSAGLEGSLARAWPDFVSQAEDSRFNRVFSAGKISRNFSLASLPQPGPGLAALNMKGEVAGLSVAGLWLPSDAIKTASVLYFAGQDKIFRPDFDFTYKQISPEEAAITGQSAGALVLSAGKTSPLKPGDVITQLSGQKIPQDTFLEEALEKFKPGDAAQIKISRGGQLLDLEIKAKELKV